ncbi:Autoinducer 2 sensor kinase/phosphatase LuxQ [Rubripirellula lacrimiformis]|uniref:histidine kinase n=1 Tax=Rubripirellula lacrimiformis TaxID=1930273 RepID=A0A517N7P3_9BACT|nr:HAMP domain-containing sensor histidine kinase [Rubripirellula lacrimiformis]QDT03130.1 Autoinducer 2 sensor kinase/phosphatase LuxQ [Rubripirellula lacrimiformis]
MALSNSTAPKHSRRTTGAVSSPQSDVIQQALASEAAAARVMSETAHDLRSPLTAVREAIRLVHDGDLGAISIDQRGCLAAAIDQCNCIDQMVGEMVQLERLRSGMPRANRSWIDVAEVRRVVDDTLQPWAVPRNIDVLWDAAENAGAIVFADASILRRLIVNLVTNAIRASRDGSTVLIRLQRSRGDEMLLWSVVDQGAGISERDIRQIADRQVSLSGGEGLGLTICRQLAAVHFSSLKLRSRLGYGTEVSFQTPALGPRSVAGAWARWRVEARGELHQPSQHHHRADGMQADDAVERVRLDPPSVAVEISQTTAHPRCEDRMAAGTVTLGAAVSRQAADAFDQCLQSQLQLFELVYRVDSRRWVWVFDTDAHSVDARIALVSDHAKSQVDGIRMAWSAPQMIPVDARRTEARLSDLMVRETLAASASARGVDQNDVRLGAAPIVHSEAAAARLDAELRRLSDQMRGQTLRLRQQARNLRPIN